MQGQQFVPGDRDKSWCLWHSVVNVDRNTMWWKNENVQTMDKIPWIPWIKRPVARRWERCPWIFIHQFLKSLATSTSEITERVPDDWLDTENGVIHIRNDRQKYLPNVCWYLPMQQLVNQGMFFISFQRHFVSVCIVEYRMAFVSVQTLENCLL